MKPFSQLVMAATVLCFISTWTGGGFLSYICMYASGVCAGYAVGRYGRQP